MHQSGIGDLCVPEVQPFEIRQVFQLHQSGVSDFRAGEINTECMAKMRISVGLFCF